MAIRRPKEQERPQERWLEVDATMTGTLTFKDPVNLLINGHFEGTLDTKGHLSIGERAQVKATIHGEKLVVGGTIQGTIVATVIVEVLATGRIHGKVATPRLVVHNGAVLHGTIEMMDQSQEGAWMNVEELARYLEVDASTIAQWVREGRLPGQREGEIWRFERAKIEEWLAQEKIK